MKTIDQTPSEPDSRCVTDASGASSPGSGAPPVAPSIESWDIEWDSSPWGMCPMYAGMPNLDGSLRLQLVSQRGMDPMSVAWITLGLYVRLVHNRSRICATARPRPADSMRPGLAASRDGVLSQALTCSRVALGVALGRRADGYAVTVRRTSGPSGAILGLTSSSISFRCSNIGGGVAGSARPRRWLRDGTAEPEVTCSLSFQDRIRAWPPARVKAHPFNRR